MPVFAISSCQCNSMPVYLYMQHEFDKLGVLSAFINQNKVSFPATFTLLRRGTTQVWEKLFHFTGMGLNSNTTEDWDIRFEWTCKNAIDGTDIAGYVWQFSAIFNRKIAGGLNTKTLMIFSFEPSLCFHGQLEIDFIYNGALNNVTTLGKISQCVFTNVYDGIGLKTGSVWNNDPTLSVFISETEPAASPTKFGLSALTR